jgi:peptide/nickel transport system permease protein
VIAYLIRRIGISIVILIGVSAFIFALLHAIYPSPALDVLGPRANVALINAFNKQNGYDQPWIEQYLRYVGNLLRGNLGYSYKLNQSVTSLFAGVWQRSAFLSGSALVLAVLIALPLGIYQAARRNSAGDYAVTALAFSVYAMPSFFLGLILIEIFALKLHWFSFEASQSPTLAGVITDPRAMALPIATLTLLSVAAFSRFMRSASMDVLAQDFIKVARAKGLPERLVLSRHLVRNASLPMVTLIGLSIPSLLAGNVITETLFNYRGLGLLFYNALGNADYDILLAYTLLGAVLTIVGNLIADVALTVADPRIRLV